MTTGTGQKVLVTGVSGYIGPHCAAELLEQGYSVRGTVRSAAREASVRRAVGSVSARADEIEFAQADLLDDAGWSEAVSGCDFVLHVASPFIMGEPKDPNDLIKPAVEGLSACSRPPQRQAFGVSC